jgi:hypothetical protein
MKVKHWLSPDPHEIELTVSIEEITEAIEEKPDDDQPRTVLMFVNRVASVLRAVTDDMIEALTPKQRDVVGTYLAEQADRYQVFVPGNAGWTQTPPTEAGLYWLWGGGPDDSPPFPVTVMKGGGDPEAVWLAVGQWGWNHPQDVSEWANAWWKPCNIPATPKLPDE